MELSKYQTRLAKNEDFHFCLGLHHKAYKVYVASIWGWDEEKQHKMFKEGFIIDQITILTLNDRPIGFYQLGEDKGHKFICDLIIDQNYQGLGIGTSVIKSIISLAKKENKPVCLGVFKLNQRAMKLYKSLGFVMIREDEAHYMMKCDHTQERTK